MTARRLAPILVVALTIVAFLPTLGNEFVNWDDDANLVFNPHYRGLGLTQLRWMFTAYHLGHWIPLAWVTFGFDYVVWGMNPAGYHLTGLLIHAGVALVFYFVSLRLLAFATSDPVARVAGATTAALLFAVHPLRVESVAWATERRDVLCALFFVSSILAYLRWTEDPARRRFYVIAVAAFTAALLSKSMAVSLPIVLLILDRFPLRRLASRAVWLEKVPFLAVAAVVAAVALRAVVFIGVLAPASEISVAERLALGSYSFAFYLWKMIVPTGLVTLYELPYRLDPLEWRFVLSAGVTLAVVAVAVALRRRWPAVLLACVVYAVVLAPVSGLLHNGPQLAADRYTYLPMLGFALLAGAGCAHLTAAWRDGRLGRGAAIGFASAALVLVVLLMTLTWQQTRTWRDSETLWTHAIAIAPSGVAYGNLAAVRLKQKRFDEALALALASIDRNPRLAGVAHGVAGIVLGNRGELDASSDHLHAALALDSTYPVAYAGLAANALAQGRDAEAENLARTALRYDPTSPIAHNVIGLLLDGRGDRTGAIQEFRAALAHDPSFAAAYNNLGAVFYEQNRLDEALDQFRRAVALEPNDAEYRNNVAETLQRKNGGGVSEVRGAGR